MNSRLFALLLAWVVLMAAPGFAEEEVPANLKPSDSGETLPVSLFKGRVSSQPGRYILGPGDVVSLKIRDLEKFDQKFTIRPDGYATVHPFGEFFLSGTDIQGLQSWLTEKFKFYLVNPELTIDIEEMRPAIVYITGAVQKPGTYQFIRDVMNSYTVSGPLQEKVEITLTNVLAKAGGVNERADIDQIQIIHASTGAKETYSLRNLLSSGEGGDIWLMPGDSIVVPELSTPMDPETFELISRSTFYKGKFPVVVLGAVGRQGEVQIDPTNNDLNAAIALAGGYVHRLSDTSEVIVQRPGNNGSYNRWVINRKKSQFPLQPGDVLYVTDSKLANVEHGLKILTNLVQGYFFGINGTQALDTLTQSQVGN